VKSAHIVDCLLPGKVKKLGIQCSYLSKKRPIKTSNNDCEIRGSEYTAYDRASLASALKIWQRDAILGNAEAHYYVGEIFAQGAGESPNYKQAINGYQQAADQDYAPALMALGRLYEAGLGVPKDLAKAMSLYRRASGLKDEHIGFAAVFDETRDQDLIKDSTLESDLSQERANSQALQGQLDSLPDKLNSKQSNV
jgi:TPR repeat protein